VQRRCHRESEEFRDVEREIARATVKIDAGLNPAAHHDESGLDR
jgi:hypothetical protein